MGLVGSAARVQEVANPGLRRQKAVQEAQRQASLREEVEKLAGQVQALELKLAGAAPADPSIVGVGATAADEPTIAELMASLQQLTAQATGEAPVSSRVIGAGVTRRPATAPYRSFKETASMVSWSADAFGKSKTPGWYHQSRKMLYASRAERAAAQPKGCYVSHSKYADEAVRVAPTGRTAF